ncbi:MAG: UPF0716 protein FxsA [Pelagibacterales bacterium]|jgi:UPF0716 protein FxsA|nr:UPF0716 protein FxsA [Pelagibacterales bacterium]|tara:strand:- start:828 stop:1250 length:423 start_codon:yes stop_codon:yes gene_type:complete
MNSLLLTIICIPALEIFLIIKVGSYFGALNTIFLIFFTAFVGIYFSRIEGLNTLRSGFVNLYQNKTPLHEMISGASIAVAALLLIIPGFITDIFGFILLFPLTRKFLVNRWIKNKFTVKQKTNDTTIDGEIVDKESKDEL